MIQGAVAARTILLITICLLLASPPAFSQQRCPPLPSATVLNEREAAEALDETLAALHADYNIKAAIITKYIRTSEATPHPAFQFVFCRIAEDKSTGIIEKFRLMSLVGREEARRGLTPGSPPPGCPPLRPTKLLNEGQIADVQKETEVALHADYSTKSATILKYLGSSDPAMQSAFGYVFCKIAIEDKNISSFTRVRLTMLFFIEAVHQKLWPASTSGR